MTCLNFFFFSFQIDSLVIGEIDDAALAAYIPTYGDRIAVRCFCVDKHRRGGNDLKRLSLFEKLRRKRDTKRNTNKNQVSKEKNSTLPTKIHLINNKRALKMTRKIEIGWIHDKKQVRKRSGGGTRVLDISKTATKTEILSHAKKLFFPNEKSRKGLWEEFSHNIVDFQGACLEEGVSVGELYETQKLGMLRFYLFTESLIMIRNDVFIKMEEDTDEHTDAVSQVIFGPSLDGQFLGDHSDTIVLVPIHSTEEAPVNTNVSTSTPFCSEMEPAVPPSSTCELLHVTVKLHRDNLLDDLIAQFKDEAMMSYSVKYSFIDEVGADADGVCRDVYAAFWTQFLDCEAEGADVRVPSLSPKWQQEEWKSVGRILAKGLKDHGYFPSRLAQAFTAAITFGENSVSPDVLFDSFMLYVSQAERDLLSTALQEALVGDDEDDLLDLLERMGVRAVLTQENLKSVLLQVAHKQIIQQPKYALDNIADVAGSTLRKFFHSVHDIHKMYDDMKPTRNNMKRVNVDHSPSSYTSREPEFATFTSVHKGIG